MPSHRVILPEPNAKVRPAVAQILARSGAVAIEADSKSVALELIAGGKGNVVLAAVAEPLDEAIAAIERITFRSDIPVLAYAELTDPVSLRRLLKAGGRDLLPVPIDPAVLTTALDQVARSAPPDEYHGVITVTGAKGGIGKTTIATNLAVAIASRTDRSVLLVDLDSRFGDAAIFLDIEPRATIIDLASAMDATDSGLTPELLRRAITPHDSGVRILPAPRNPNEWGEITPFQVQQIIALGRELFDYVVIDTPAGFTDLVGAAIDQSDAVVMATSLEIASVRDTRLALQLLAAMEFPGEGVSLVVNQLHEANTFDVSDVAEILDHEVSVHIPYDEVVLHDSANGVPIVLSHPNTRAAKQLLRIAALYGPEPNADNLESPINIIGRFRRRLPSGSRPVTTPSWP